MSRYARVILLLCLWAAPVFGQLSESVIERIVELRVQRRKYINQHDRGQLDFRTYSERSRSISAELTPLENQLYSLPLNVRHEVEGRIDSLVKSRLAAVPSERQGARRAPGPEDWAGRSDSTGRVDPWAAQRHMPPPPLPAPPRRAAPPAPPRRGPAPVPTQQVAPSSGAGQNWASRVHQYIPAQVIRSFIAAAWIGAIYWLRQRLQKMGKKAANWPDIWWYAAVLLIVWMWAVPVDYAPSGISNAEFYARALLLRAVAILCGCGVLYGVSVAAGALFTLFEWLFIEYQPSAPAMPVSTVHGTARYAPMQSRLTDEDCLAKGVFLGKSSNPGAAAGAADFGGVPICSTPEHHTLIVARTRTGKGTRVIIPTLLRYEGSALVIDPKGENAAVTAATRALDLGQEIYILNPWNELQSVYKRRGFEPATYNPLDILDRNDPNVVAIAQALAGTVCAPIPGNRDPYWQEQAATVLAAVFLWLTDRPDERKTLARAREIISLSRKNFTDKFLVPMAASEAFSGAIREMAAPYVDLADNTYSGIMSNLAGNTKFLSDPRIKEATATSSFSMKDLAAERVTVYVVLPTEQMDIQKTWLRLVIASAMHVFKHRKEARRDGHRCLFLIDEFPALGRFDVVLSDIATMSGFGVDFALVVQGLDQLKAHYHDAQGIILSNCAYKWFCNISDLETAKYVSESLGKATVRTVSSSESSSSGSHNNSSNTASTTYGETGRSLLTPDEVQSLGRGVVIAMQPHGRPHYLEPVDYWRLPDAFAALKQKYPDLYWDPPLAYDDNPYVSRRGNR